MRIFLYEYLSYSASAGAASSLLAEGRAMFAAAAADLAAVPGATLATMVPADAAGPGGEEAAFRKLAGSCLYSLIIAPEFDGVLEARCRWVHEAGGRLLGPDPAAIRLCADKRVLADRFLARGVPTPPCIAWGETVRFPAVCKPRDGAGSLATFLVQDELELQSALKAARAEGWAGEVIVQPYVPGEAASVAFLIGPGRRLALPPAAQHLSADGRFRYRGGRLTLPSDRAARATRLAERAVDAVAGLHGYVGVDVVLGADDDGLADAVIELNPRLTTSYIGLRRLARFNLMEALLAVVDGSQPPAWDWGAEEVRFWADGRASGGRQPPG
jgi:predicted ATP-grasp superfamily ATP-dependent carboligase